MDLLNCSFKMKLDSLHKKINRKTLIMSVKVVLWWCISHGELLLDLELTHNEWEAPGALELCPLSWPVADPALRIRSSHIRSVHPFYFHSTWAAVEHTKSDWGFYGGAKKRRRVSCLREFFLFFLDKQTTISLSAPRCVVLVLVCWVTAVGEGKGSL